MGLIELAASEELGPLMRKLQNKSDKIPAARLVILIHIWLKRI
jgi:hypothetical protein